jgi:L-fucose isomerase-like protein
LGFRYKYVYECADAPGRSVDKVLAFARVAKAAAMLRAARVGMMGYRDMNLYGALVDQVSLRRVIGPEVEVFDTLEVTQAMERLDETEVTGLIEDSRCSGALCRTGCACTWP